MVSCRNPVRRRILFLWAISLFLGMTNAYAEIPINFGAWSVDAMVADGQTVAEYVLPANKIESFTISKEASRGGGYFQPFTSVIPVSTTDTRCLTDDCGYWLDISELKVSVYSNHYTSVNTQPWGLGGYKGNVSGSVTLYGGPKTLYGRLDSGGIIRIRKKGNGLAPVASKTVNISFGVCNPGGYYYQSTCNSYTNTGGSVKGIVKIAITIPAPTLPPVQCTMGAWTPADMTFNPVSVPLATKGSAVWPAGAGNFIGAQSLQSHLNVTCTNVTDPNHRQDIPLQVKLSGTGWQSDGANSGAVYFGAERNLAMNFNLSASALNTDFLTLDNTCTDWTSNSATAAVLTQDKMAHALAGATSNCLMHTGWTTGAATDGGIDFTLNAILGVRPAPQTTPAYGKHAANVIVEITSP